MTWDVVAQIHRSTGALVDALGHLDNDGLRAPSLLPGWTRLTIACHLRYGARALSSMTNDAETGQPTS